MNILQPENDDRYSDDKIHISALAYTKCDRMIYFQCNGFKEKHDETMLWHFAVGKAIHGIIQRNYIIASKNTVFVEQKVEYKSIVGSVDLIEVSNQYIDIIDIKSTNSFCFEKPPSDYMERQVSIYSGIIGSTKTIKISKGSKIRPWIWKVNKGGLPRYFDYDKDRYPVSMDIYGELDNAVKRADGILKCLKDKRLPEGDKSNCSKCPARALCIVESNKQAEIEKYGGKK